MTKKTKRLIQNFEDAVRGDEIKGSREPQEAEEMEKEYKRAKNILLYHVGFLEAQAREEDK